MKPVIKIEGDRTKAADFARTLRDFAAAIEAGDVDPSFNDFEISFRTKTWDCEFGAIEYAGVEPDLVETEACA